MTSTYVALDLETTGLDPERDRIIEVGATRFDSLGNELETFSYVVNPGREVPAFIERFTGVTNEMTARAPKLASVRPELERFVGDAIVKLLSKSNPAVLVQSHGTIQGIVTRSDMLSFMMAR